MITEIEFVNRESNIEQKLIDEFINMFKDLTGKEIEVYANTNKLITSVLTHMTIDEIYDVVEEFRDKSHPTLDSGRRKREVVNLKKIFARLCVMGDHRQSAIASKIKLADHTATIYLNGEAMSHIDTDPAFKNLFNLIKNDIILKYESRYYSTISTWDNSKSTLPTVLP